MMVLNFDKAKDLYYSGGGQKMVVYYRFKISAFLDRKISNNIQQQLVKVGNQ